MPLIPPGAAPNRATTGSIPSKRLLHRPTTILEIGIGTVIGTGLTRASLEQLQILWRPALLITVTLVLTGIVIGLWSSRLLRIDPVVALLGAAPGGISGMSLVGAEFGVGAAVAALHAVRLITVLLVLPLVVRLVSPGQ